MFLKNTADVEINYPISADKTLHIDPDGVGKCSERIGNVVCDLYPFVHECGEPEGWQEEESKEEVVVAAEEDEPEQVETVEEQEVEEVEEKSEPKEEEVEEKPKKRGRPPKTAK